MNYKKLEDIGFSHWFQSQLDDDKIASHEVARVISVHKDRYVVTNGDSDACAKLAGALSYKANSSTELPTVGDWVYTDFYDDDTQAIIHGVAPRKTILKRKIVGTFVDFQLIAVNIEVALILQSVDDNFNLRRLERYLVMVKECEITPVILLSKCDLISQDEVNELKESILDIAPQVLVLTFSYLNLESIDAIKDYLLHGKTYCLIGSSGVGKTTLLNSILGDEQFETQSLSKKNSKGRHTTTSRELIQLENGAMLIDTPGMRELGNMSVDAGIDETFSEILEFSKECKFNNCSHNNEKGCAVLTAIEKGKLSKHRYQNYLEMKKESKFKQLSYSDKRKKNKNFGKLTKSTTKNKKRW